MIFTHSLGRAAFHKCNMLQNRVRFRENVCAQLFAFGFAHSNKAFHRKFRNLLHGVPNFLFVCQRFAKRQNIGEFRNADCGIILFKPKGFRKRAKCVHIAFGKRRINNDLHIAFFQIFNADVALHFAARHPLVQKGFQFFFQKAICSRHFCRKFKITVVYAFQLNGHGHAVHSFLRTSETGHAFNHGHNRS